MSGMTPQDTCVLIPAFNEAKTITWVIRQVQAEGFKVIVSDDGSIDGTASVSRSLGVQVLTADSNQGKGASVRRRIREFLKSGSKAFILMDSDGQHDAAELGHFLEALNLKTADLVIGNRMGSPEGMPWIRRLTNHSMSWILSRIAGQSIPDSQCGYRAMTRLAAETILIRSDRFEVESEMILEAARHKFKIASIPVRSVYAEEASRIHPLKDTLRFFLFLFKYSWFDFAHHDPERGASLRR